MNLNTTDLIMHAGGRLTTHCENDILQLSGSLVSSIRNASQKEWRHFQAVSKKRSAGFEIFTCNWPLIFFNHGYGFKMDLIMHCGRIRRLKAQNQKHIFYLVIWFVLIVQNWAAFKLKTSNVLGVGFVPCCSKHQWNNFNKLTFQK